MKYKKNILALVDEYQYNAAVTYPKTNERIYGNFKIAAILAFIYLKYSKQGYEISVVGESEKTAKYIGINVKKVAFLSHRFGKVILDEKKYKIKGGAS